MRRIIDCVEFLQDYFRGVSQALFFRDARFGAGILAIFAIFAPELLPAALFASAAGYAYSVTYSTPYLLKHYGLMTINGFFFGIALASQYRHSELFYLYLVLGSLTLPLLTKAVFEVLSHWKLSPFIAPYLIMSWMIALASQGANLPDAFPQTVHFSGFARIALVETTFLSLGRMLFVPSAAFGLAVFALVLAFSPRRAAYFALGSFIATAVAFAITLSSEAWRDGQYSFSAGLVGLGLASFPEKFSARTIALFCAFSAFATVASESLLTTLKLPLLSAPYVLTLWVACLSRVPKHQISWAPRDVQAQPALARLPAAGSSESSRAGKRAPERVA